MKKNNILITVLIGLVLLFVLTNYFNKNNSTNFKAEVVQLDSAQISKVSMYSSGATDEEPIIIKRGVNQWEVSQGDIKRMANQSNVKNILGRLQNIKAERLVAKKKEKWAAYELTDSLARWIEIQEKGEGNKTKLYFGKNTFFRINDKLETYALKTGLSNMLNHKFNFWRNSDFLKVNKDSITQLEFQANGKNDYLLSKTDSIWTMGIFPTDSTKVVQYLNRLRNQNSSNFADSFAPKNEADYRLTIRGKSMKDIIVKAYRDTVEKKFFMNSSQYPDAFVKSDSIGLFNRLFVNQDYFKINID